jgi:hypothetical protein
MIGSIILWDEPPADLRAELSRAKARKREFLNAGKWEMADRAGDEIGRLLDQLWEIEGYRGLDEFAADAAYARMR